MALGVPCKKSAVFATGTFNLLIFSTGDVPSLTAKRNGIAAQLRCFFDVRPLQACLHKDGHRKSTGGP